MYNIHSADCQRASDVTWRKWMWSSVCESCSSSASLLLSSAISCSSRSRSPSARLTSAFSWSLISSFTSEHLLSMERISSVKILSLSSTAALCRALLGDTERGGLYILTRPFTQLLLGPQAVCSPQCGSVGLSPTGLESGPTLGSSLADWRRALTEPWNGSSSSQLLSSPLVSTHLERLHSLSQILQLLLSLLDSLLEFTLCLPQLLLWINSFSSIIVIWVQNY